MTRAAKDGKAAHRSDDRQPFMALTARDGDERAMEIRKYPFGDNLSAEELVPLTHR